MCIWTNVYVYVHVHDYTRTCISLSTTFLLHSVQCVTGRDECNPTYSYRHQLGLTKSSEQFAVSYM